MPKLHELFDRATGVTPVPPNCTVNCAFEPLSLTVNVPVRPPSTLGVKVIKVWQVEPADNVFGASGHFEVSAKSPETEMLLMVIGAVCVLLRVTILPALVVCTTTFPNAILATFKV